MNVRLEGQNAIVKMSKRHEAENAVQRGTVINEHRTLVKWYNEPVDTKNESAEHEGEDVCKSGET